MAGWVRIVAPNNGVVGRAVREMRVAGHKTVKGEEPTVFYVLQGAQNLGFGRICTDYDLRWQSVTAPPDSVVQVPDEPAPVLTLDVVINRWPQVIEAVRKKFTLDLRKNVYVDSLHVAADDKNTLVLKVAATASSDYKTLSKNRQRLAAIISEIMQAPLDVKIIWEPQLDSEQQRDAVQRAVDKAQAIENEPLKIATDLETRCVGCAMIFAGMSPQAISAHRSQHLGGIGGDLVKTVKDMLDVEKRRQILEEVRQFEIAVKLLQALQAELLREAEQLDEPIKRLQECHTILLEASKLASRLRS